MCVNEPSPYSNIITLNIGGTKFVTSLETLQSPTSDYFRARFSGIHYSLFLSLFVVINIWFEGTFKNGIHTDGSYFVDRDPEHFRSILLICLFLLFVPIPRELALAYAFVLSIWINEICSPKIILITELHVPKRNFSFSASWRGNGSLLREQVYQNDTTITFYLFQHFILKSILSLFSFLSLFAVFASFATPPPF